MSLAADLYMGSMNGLREVWSNKVRSLLSMSGIILGVAALVAMVGILQGMLGNMRASFELRGGILKMEVSSAEAPEWQQHIVGISPGLTWQDVLAFEKAIPLITYVSPIVDLRWARFTAAGRRTRAMLQGVSPDFFGIETRRIAYGRTISDADINASSPVVVIGTYVAERLFPDRDNIVGEQVRLDGKVFTVIGQFEHFEVMVAGRNTLRWENRRNYIPATTAMTRFNGNEKVSSIAVLGDSVERLEDLQEQMNNTLALTHRGIEDFEVRTQHERLEEMQKLENSFLYSMGGIAAISLLVGGIGIMNVMLASVSERIREIGVRKALGARSHDIFLQFLAEAVVISILGGLIGLLLSIGFLTLARNLIPDGATIDLIPTAAMFLGFLFSSLIGLVSGIYPALRAGRLDPIEALRYD